METSKCPLIKRDIIIIGIVENAKKTSSNIGMYNRAITVLHEQRMCPGMQRHIHITLCSMVPMSVPFQHLCTFIYICVTLRGWIKSATTHFISYKVCATRTVYTDRKLLQKINLTSCSNCLHKCKTSDGIPR